MSIKSKLFKGLAVVSLLLPIAFSANSINNVNASAKKTHAVKVVKHDNSNKATAAFADEMYDFSSFFKKDLLPTVKNYKAETKSGKETKAGLLEMLNDKMSKKQFRSKMEKSMKSNPEFKKTSAKERNKMFSESTKAFKNVKLSDLNKISSLAKRWTLVLLQVNDGKTTIHLPAMK
ncbi:hypothetical protein DY102_04425 [Apilactobacillus timberlakei]|uniref:hypothetical protein n=1 Tax=Apilactobacillus timberlakei TaxID=2008380 RepID=UPI001127AFFB|nr:hypothetical protein [Apilactobacillus timberlakei]TPR23293.1 hypothetical protein DY102_04425 [Apilactobacillus timberlakei]